MTKLWRRTYAACDLRQDSDTGTGLPMPRRESPPHPLLEEGQYHALRLIALAAAVRGEMGTQRDPVEQEIHDKTLAAIQDSFSREAIDAAFEEARQSTFDEAVAWALESVE